jgi:hypothetical protein
MYPRPNAKMPKIIKAKREYKNMAFLGERRNSLIIKCW